MADIAFEAPEVEFDQVLPFDLWVLVASALEWPDRAFFAAACQGFAAAAERASQCAQPPASAWRLPGDVWHAVRRRLGLVKTAAKGPRVVVARDDWLCFVTSESRVRKGLCEGRLDEQTYKNALSVAMSLGLPGAAEALIERVGRPSAEMQTSVFLHVKRLRSRKRLDRLADLCGLTDANFAARGTIFRVAARAGCLEICEWLIGRFGAVAGPGSRTLDHDGALLAAAASGSLGFCKALVARPEFAPVVASLRSAGPSEGRWTADSYRSRLLSAAFQAAVRGPCVSDALEYCGWAADLLGLQPTDGGAENRMALVWAARQGSAAVCEWLADRCGLTADDARANNCAALRWAARLGHLAVCEWLAARFELTPADAAVDNHIVLREAATYGHLDVCQWLARRFVLECASAPPSGLVRPADPDAPAAVQRADALRAAATTALRKAAENDHLDVCVWLADTFGLTAADARAWDNEALRCAAHSGHLDVCKWLVGRFELTHEDAAVRGSAVLVCAAVTGRTDLGKWLAHTFDLTTAGVTEAAVTRALCTAAENGHLEFCEWLAGRFPFGAESAKSNACDALHRAAARDHLEVCEWLADYFDLTADHARSLNNAILRESAAEGRLALCEWLADRFGLGAADVRAQINEALVQAATHGHLEVCRCLADRFGLTAADARARANGALRLAAGGGHLELCIWLVDRFGLGPEDARAHGNDALGRAAVGGHLRVCVWLAYRFEFGRADAKVALYALEKSGPHQSVAYKSLGKVWRWLVERFHLEDWAGGDPGGQRVAEAETAAEGSTSIPR